MNFLDKYLFSESRTIHLNHSWLLTSHSLCLFRMGCFVYSLGIYSMSNILMGTFYKGYQYLTYWGEVLTMIAFLFLTIDSIEYIQKRKDKKLTRVSKIAILFNEVAFSFELTIVLLFWVSVYPSDEEKGNSSVYYPSNLHTHMACLVLMWIENFLNYIEFVPNHLFVLIFVGLCYVVDNVIVTLFINFDPVYKVLTWTDGMSYGVVVGAFIIFVLHFLFSILVFRKFKSKKEIIYMENEIASQNKDESHNGIFNVEMEKQNGIENK